MSNSPKRVSCTIALLLAAVLTLDQSLYAVDLPNTFAASQVAVQPAPPPSQIASAQTIFLTNAGEDANFPIDTADSFNGLYAALKSWGHYRLVPSPDQADLVFQLHGVAPITNITGTRGDISSITSPAFQLVILDPKTNVALWTITSPVDLAGRGQTRARWVSLAESNLVSRIKVIAGQPLSPAESANLTTVPNRHRGRNIAIAVGAFTGVAVGGALIGHHLYENSVANGKAEQDAFCQANHIPISMCAGG
jgi:hypothetical protein